MSIFIISDIHGSLYYLNKALDFFTKENADKILILGDELYHGPRNPLPKEYNPKEAALLLNSFSDKIIAVRGNCDSEVDDMVLDFPIMSTYSMVFFENIRLFLTHGHIYNETSMPPLTKSNVFLYGHTHIPRAEKKDDLFFINPGSISLPKDGHPNSFCILKDNIFQIKDFENNLLKQIVID
jgi:uncharacterized protein